MITSGTEDGPGMPCKCLASALLVYQSSVSLLPAFFKFFLDGSTDHNIASNPRPQGHSQGSLLGYLLIQEVV